MIPLRDWLADPHRQATAVTDVPVNDVHQLPEIITEQLVFTDAEASFRNREEELLTALQQTEERMEQMSLVHAESERELSRQLGIDLADRLSTEISRAFADMLSQIEDALFQVLVPFLDNKVRTKTVSDLLDLVRQELGKVDTPTLEIKAPAWLHAVLEELEEGSGVAVQLMESETIEVVLGAQHRRFEELSSNWLATIDGSRP